MRKKLIGYLLVIVLIALIKGCSDDTLPTINNGDTDPGIYMTDEFGNFLGGDTTDWCLSPSGMTFGFGAAYPNPTAGQVVHIKFLTPVTDTIKLFFLNGNNDSTIFFNQHVQPGTYIFTINDSTNQYANSFRRLYLSSKRFSASQYCRFYGDIKFTP